MNKIQETVQKHGKTHSLPGNEGPLSGRRQGREEEGKIERGRMGGEKGTSERGGRIKEEWALERGEAGRRVGRLFDLERCTLL
jgi:hypothetical protein